MTDEPAKKKSNSRVGKAIRDEKVLRAGREVIELGRKNFDNDDCWIGNLKCFTKGSSTISSGEVTKHGYVRYKIQDGYHTDESGNYKMVPNKNKGAAPGAQRRSQRFIPVFANRLVLAAEGHNIEGLDASHLCHEPKCINPKHLWPETHAVNMSRKECPGQGLLGYPCLHNPQCLHTFVEKYKKYEQCVNNAYHHTSSS